MKVSVAIMAHKDREEYVQELKQGLPKGTKAFWDKKNDEWDTARRALLARDPDADFHVVLQDDAIICENFVESVEAALEQADEFAPASFYVGRGQPEAIEVQQIVDKTIKSERSWFTMQGPLWGVAVAIPTGIVKLMVEAIDEDADRSHSNYDMLMSEYFLKRNIECWYSNPSLADHRQGPSLVDPKKDQIGRVAFNFYSGDATELEWGGGRVPWLRKEQRRWSRAEEGYKCGSCGQHTEWLGDMIRHHIEAHDLGVVDFLATNKESRDLMKSVRDRMPFDSLGDLWLVGQGGVRETKLKRLLSRNPKRFIIVDSYLAMKYVEGRNAWSMDNQSVEVANA